MNEATLKSNLVKRIRERWPHAVVFRLEDRMTHGIPDICVTMGKRTSWWEVKYAAPDFKSPGIQELTLKRLAKNGYAYYIVFEDVPAGKLTYIVKADDIADWKRTIFGATRGFDYDAVLTFIEATHQL